MKVLAYEVLGKKAPLDLAGSKGEPGEKGKKGIKGLRGDDEYPRSIDVGPGFGDGVAPSAGDINVSPYTGDTESYAGWMAALRSGSLSITVSSPSGRYKSDSLGTTLDKIVWYRYYIAGPGKISDCRLETGEDGEAIFTCHWAGLTGDVPFLAYDALVVFEYIADDAKSFLDLEE